MRTAGTPRDRYERDGFLVYPETAIGAETVHRATEGMDRIRQGIYGTGVAPEPSPWNPGDDLGALCKIEMPQVADPAVWDLVAHPEIGRRAAEATGAHAVQVWWVQLLYKPTSLPEDAPRTNVGWHQDRQYWGAWEDGSELLTAWVALSDVAIESGAMRFVRGSHRWGLVEGGDFYGQNHGAQMTEIRTHEQRDWEEVPAILPAGGLSLHHHLTLHASGPNVSAVPRRSFAIHLRTDRSAPRRGQRQGLTRDLDDMTYCPVVYGAM